MNLNNYVILSIPVAFIIAGLYGMFIQREKKDKGEKMMREYLRNTLMFVYYLVFTIVSVFLILFVGKFFEYKPLVGMFVLSILGIILFTLLSISHKVIDASHRKVEE